MCLSIYNQTNVKKLCIAAQAVQQIIDDGILPEAFDKNRHGEAHKAIVVFDTLAKAAAVVAEEQKDISPFLRYRREILSHSEIGWHLRNLVMNIYEGHGVDLFALFSAADAHHTRIALECLTIYTNPGVSDRHFMNLVAEIGDMNEPNHSEVAA